MTDMKKLATVSTVLNPESNGGEAVVLSVEIFDNGDAAAGLPNGIFTIGSMTLNSYCNSSSMSLGSISPEILREFADKLEAKLIEVKKAFGVE